MVRTSDQTGASSLNARRQDLHGRKLPQDSVSVRKYESDGEVESGEQAEHSWGR